MSLGQGLNTPSGHKQSLCELPISLHRKDMDRTKILRFSARHLEIARKTFGQGHDTPSDHKQSLCEL